MHTLEDVPTIYSTGDVGEQLPGQHSEYFYYTDFPHSNLQRALEESKTVSGVFHRNSYMRGLE